MGLGKQVIKPFNPFPNDKSLDPGSNWKSLQMTLFKFDENGGKFIKRVKNTVGKGEIACYESSKKSGHFGEKLEEKWGDLKKKVESFMGKREILFSQCFQIFSISVLVTLSQMTNFRPFQIERVCRLQFYILWQWQKVLQIGRKHWEKEKLLITSNFSFSNSVFKRLVLQTHINQGLFGKGLNCWLLRIGLNTLSGINTGLGWWEKSFKRYKESITVPATAIFFGTKERGLPQEIYMWNMKALSLTIEKL